MALERRPATKYDGESGLGLLEDVIHLIVRQLVYYRLHLHAYLNVLIRDVFGDSAKDFIISVVQNGYAIWEITFESNRPVLQFAEGQKRTRSADLKPFHIAGQALKAIGSGREKLEVAFFAFGSHNLALFQISDEIIRLCNSCEAHSSKLLESIIDLFFRHVRTSQE
jgi:hypothetical protein